MIIFLERAPMALARIMKELKDMKEDIPEYVKAGPYYPDDLYHRQATILGPLVLQIMKVFSPWISTFHQTIQLNGRY